MRDITDITISCGPTPGKDSYKVIIGFEVDALLLSDPSSSGAIRYIDDEWWDIADWVKDKIREEADKLKKPQLG